MCEIFDSELIIKGKAADFRRFFRIYLYDFLQKKLNNPVKAQAYKMHCHIPQRGNAHTVKHKLQQFHN